MNKIRNTLRNNPSSLIILGITLFSILIIGMGLSAIIATITIIDKQLYLNELCFSSDCARFFTKTIEPAISIAKATLDFGVAVATMGGIFVALLSYFNTSSNAALTNHIEHLKVFTEYIEAEIEKRDRLSRSHFDILLLYGKIFSLSRVGKTTVSDDYRQFLVSLNKIIAESNERCSIGTPGGFSYKEHQRRIREHMVEVGVTVYTAPRNDYFETEKQLLSLFHRLSQSFCHAGELPNICNQKYY
ncbi:retron Ec48 family effector membrane protein [Delftia acidovorans]|uniref:retron Ec48 family effector membrane protein n=1 Tax=Delftia acidovorans TaxID=80866 RepID=UPI0028E21FCA|nr:retron Ec48 family effector membrane protein [Delftia acidovorans]